MKDNSMNDSGKGTVLKSRPEELLGSNSSRTMQAGGVALLALMAIVLLGGCAAIPESRTLDPSQYNPITGYPAVGSGMFWQE
jgi:hypothetical protein